MAEEKMNVLNTSKGSAFFVDLDKVIQNEAKRELQLLQEKQVTGTALFIPLFDCKNKSKKKVNKTLNKKHSIGSKTEALNRTFTKEDFEALKEFDADTTIQNVVNTKDQKKNNYQENAKDINFQSVLEHNEIIAPLLDLEPPQGARQIVAIPQVSNNKITSPAHISRNRANTSPRAQTERDSKTRTKLLFQKDIKKQLFEDNEQNNIEMGKLRETGEWTKTHLPQLPKWATGNNLSLDSAILNLHPFLEPFDEPYIHQRNEGKNEEPGKQQLKIEDMFPVSIQPQKKYVTAVLPAICRGTSARSAIVINKGTPSSPKRKKPSSAKKTNQSTSKSVTKISVGAKKNTPKQTVRKGAKKKNKGKKSATEKSSASEDTEKKAETDVETKMELSSILPDKTCKILTSAEAALQIPSAVDTNLDTIFNIASNESIAMPANTIDTFDSDNMIQPNYDSIFDFYEQGNIKSLALSNAYGENLSSSFIKTGNSLSKRDTENCNKTEHEALTMVKLELHNSQLIPKHAVNIVNYFEQVESDNLVESLEKTLSIDTATDHDVVSPHKRFPQNNFLSKISEEASQSLQSSAKSKVTNPTRVSIISDKNSKDTMSDSVVRKFEFPSFKSHSDFDSIDDNDEFAEITRLIFQPGAAPTSSIDSSSDQSDGLSSARRYLRSVIGSCRSVYSPTASESSIASQREVLEWQKGKVIDRGAFGVVYQGLTSRAQLIAVKEVQIGESKNKEKNYQKLQDEITILKGLHHRNIIKFIGTSLEDDVVYIFMEYIAGGSLAGLISSFGPLKEIVFQRYTKQILSAVIYLHTHGVIHRDIKGANILITVKGVIKLIDFGCAKELSLSLGSTVLLKSVKGTPYWMAPEVIQGTGCNHKSDIWSVGCTVMEMATGKPPWSEYTPYAAMYAIADNANKPPQLNEIYSENACSFVSCCLTRLLAFHPAGWNASSLYTQRDMTCRPSAEDLLVHPFICL